MKVWLLGFSLMAGMALGGPEVSKRPVARPDTPLDAALAVILQESGAIGSPSRNAQAVPKSAQGIATSLRPKKRTRKVRRLARQHAKLRTKGAVCNDLDIQGEVIGRVPGKIAGCGISNAVRVRSIAGVTLSQASVMDCSTAQALKVWTEESAQPALGRLGGGLKTLRVAAHYSCRTRNNKKGARISEHGKGRAIDISGFTLRDGTKISVLKGWIARETAKPLRLMHRGACGPFGTVLGPDADRYHRDHFHFDTARYRTGTYCR